jgi:hypothetical protein
MNQGFFSFPNQYLKDNPNVYVKEFDVSGTFAIPSFCKRLFILLIGGGGSGGSGARQPSSTNSCGGAGGGGGSMFIEDIPLYMLNAPPGTILNVVIGSGGSAPSGASADGTTGVAGNAGGLSSITVNGKPGLIAVAAGGGAGGLGGTSTTSTGAAGTSTSWWFGNICGSGHGGGNGAVTGFASGPGGTPIPLNSNGVWNWQSNGGCGAGGVDTTNTASNGGAVTAGGLVTSQYSTIYSSGNNIIQPGTANSPTVVYGSGDSFGYTIAGAYSPGLGGVGGGGGTSTDGGRGRNGYRGGGGGGGGGARNGFNGGDGGAGGNGYCVIIAY